MASELKEVSSENVFGGQLKTFTHQSKETGCEMKFGVYLPPKYEPGRCPVIYYLAGLTCTHEVFFIKSGATRLAAELGVILVSPDTSPRGCNIEGEEDGWDFGTGAGFYLTATEPKWAKNYRMFTYVTQELRSAVNENFPNTGKQSIMGHSMGGHGALVCSLKNPGMYASTSAFSPICNPINCPWGEKAFTGYLGPDKETWKEWDSCELMLKYDGPKIELLVDQGTGDQFYIQKQLLPEALVKSAADQPQVNLSYRAQAGYTHSYFFISSFMEDHMRHHAKFLL